MHSILHSVRVDDDYQEHIPTPSVPSSGVVGQALPVTQMMMTTRTVDHPNGGLLKRCPGIL